MSKTWDFWEGESLNWDFEKIVINIFKLWKWNAVIAKILADDPKQRENILSRNIFIWIATRPLDSRSLAFFFC